MSDHSSLISITLLNSIIVVIAVLLHYECLHRLSSLMAVMRQSHKFRLVVAVFGVLVAHGAQVWLFASAYYFMHKTEGWGELAGNFTGQFTDCVYFSFTTFTTLGYGDIEPLGALRYLTGIEALAGLVLITWSASFLYMEMQRYWPDR